MEPKMRDLQTALTEKGGFLLGEPYVQLKPRPVTQHTDFSVFFSHKTHGAHFILFDSTMLAPLIPTATRISNVDSPVITFTEFIEYYGNQNFIIDDFVQFNQMNEFTDTYSLKIYGGLKVLEQEHGIIFRGMLHEVIFLFHELMRTSNNMKVEHCIYLAKTTNESAATLKDFMHIPFQLLPDVIPLNYRKYKTVTFPYAMNEELQAKRKTLPILKP